MLTTRLLDEINEVMPRRHQYILAAIVAFMTLGSAATTIGDWRARASAAPPPPIVVIATPATPAGASGLAKAVEFAPLAVPSPAPPTAAPPTPAAPDVETGAVPAFAAATAAPAPTRPRQVHERPSDKAGPGGGE
jgi:hypothetical protein